MKDNAMSPEPNINFLPSVINSRGKLRAIADKIYITPLNGTFPQFLEDHTIELIGNQWWLQQERTKKDDQSCLFRWVDEFYRTGFELKIKNPLLKLISIPNEGTHLSWMSFCYDLLCLEQKFALPKALIKRLTKNQDFQSARYEVAIGAVFVRAGFDITWIDPSHKTKSCEFMATHRRTGYTLGVEAKSKPRSNVLNEKRVNLKEEVTSLLKDALEQTPAEKGFLIFIDLNLNSNTDEEKFMNQANIALEKAIKPSSNENPHSFSLITFINFPFHHGESKVNYAFA